MPPHRSSAVVLAATTGIEVLAREDPGWLARPSLTDLWHLLLPCVAAPHLAGALDPAGTEPEHAGPDIGREPDIGRDADLGREPGVGKEADASREPDVGRDTGGALEEPGRAGLALR
jgi:hypothetical protein